MTADIELLPLPEYFQRDLSHMTWEGLSQAAIDYAHANVEASTEALRAEVERLKASCQQAADGVVVYADRAERLAEALRWYAEQAAGCRKLGRDGDAARAALDADGGGRARAALEQE